MKKNFVPLILVAFLLFSALPVMADETAETTPALEVTLQKALDMAMKDSNSLKSADIDIDRGFVVREKSGDNVKYVPVGSGTQNAQAVQNFSSLVQNDLKWRNAKKTKEAQIDSVVYAVYQSYSDVLKSQEKIKTNTAAVANAQWKARIARIGMMVGTVSKTDLVVADSQLEKAKATLEAAQKELADNFVKLNFLIGLQPEDRPVLTDTLPYTPLEEVNIESEAERAVEESPTIWIANSNVDINWQLKDFANPSETGAMDLRKAQLSASTAKDSTKKAVRDTYLGIKQLEEQYNALVETFNVSEVTMRVLKVKYDAGIVTKSELLAADADLAQVRQTLFETVCKHELMKIAFKKPWAAGSSAIAGF